MSWGSYSQKRDCWVKGYDDFRVMPPEKSSAIYTATNKELAFLILLQSSQHRVLPLWFNQASQPLFSCPPSYIPLHRLGLRNWHVVWYHTDCFSLSLPTHKIGDVITDIFKGKRTYIYWASTPYAGSVLSPLMRYLPHLLIIYLPDTCFVPDPVLWNTQQSLLS